MSLETESDQVERLADELAIKLRTTRSDAVRIALENELRRVAPSCSGAPGATLADRLRPLQDRIAARPEASDADKRFFDELSGDL